MYNAEQIYFHTALPNKCQWDLYNIACSLLIEQNYSSIILVHRDELTYLFISSIVNEYIFAINNINSYF